MSIQTPANEIMHRYAIDLSRGYVTFTHTQLVKEDTAAQWEVGLLLLAAKIKDDYFGWTITAFRVERLLNTSKNQKWVTDAKQGRKDLRTLKKWLYPQQSGSKR